MNILFTSAGRRVGLIRAFREQEGVGMLAACDTDAAAPALYEADRAFRVPEVHHPSYVPGLLTHCREYDIRLLIPLIDPELPVLASAHAAFDRAGIYLMVSSPAAVELSQDKLKTASFFAGLGVPTARTAPYDPAADWSGWTFPVVLKPAGGSAGQDVRICRDGDELAFLGARTRAALVQERLSGPEVTIDLLSDGSGLLLGLGQRRRLKVRAGEVERAVTIWDEEIARHARAICAHLKPRGAVNVQCFLTPAGPVFTEINARFGGGYPLSYRAGANFPRRIIAMAMGQPQPEAPETAVPGLVMMRHDAEIFRRDGELIP